MQIRLYLYNQLQKYVSIFTCHIRRHTQKNVFSFSYLRKFKAVISTKVCERKILQIYKSSRVIKKKMLFKIKLTRRLDGRNRHAGEIFAANAHLGARTLCYLVVFTSCVCSFAFGYFAVLLSFSSMRQRDRKLAALRFFFRNDTDPLS